MQVALEVFSRMKTHLGKAAKPIGAELWSATRGLIDNLASDG